MKTLIKKDIKIVGILISFVLIILGLLLATILKLVDDNFIRYIFYIGIMIFMLGWVHAQLWANDLYFKSDLFLNSLPLDRRIIVSSRYVTMLVYISYIALIVFVSSYTFVDGSPVYPINVNEILNISSITILLIAFYLPTYYLRENKDDRTYDILIFIIMAIIMILRSSYINKNILYRSISILDLNQSPLLFILISLASYIGSLYFSIKIYESKEFY